MICSVDDCHRPFLARGLCSTHYAAARRAGQFDVRRHPRATLEERLLRKVDRSGGPDDCWPWTGARNEKGYGITYVFDGPRRVSIGAHKAALIVAGRGVDADLEVLHSCDNPPCCNPAHLRAGTHLENMADRSTRGAENPSGNWSPRFIPLSEEVVADIRSAYRYGVRGHSLRAVAMRFGLDQKMVWDIVNHKGRWADAA